MKYLVEVQIALIDGRIGTQLKSVFKFPSLSTSSQNICGF